MANISSITLPNNSSYDLVDAKASHFVSGTQAAATNVWTGDLPPGVSDYYHGLSIDYFLPFAGTSTAATLNLGGKGAKPVYRGDAPTTGVKTNYPALSVIHLTYVINASINSGNGAWITDAYHFTNDPNYRNLNYYGLYNTYANLYRYEVLLTRDGNMLLPTNSVSNGYKNASKAMTTEEFDPFGEIYYYPSTSSVAAGGNIAAAILYRQYLVDMRYGFNVGISSGNYLTARDPIYLVAVPQSNGKAKLHTTPITNILPSSEDGLIYIYLGHAYDTYRIELAINHPVYYYKNGAIRIFTNAERGNDSVPYISHGTWEQTVTSASVSFGVYSVPEPGTYLISGTFAIVSPSETGAVYTPTIRVRPTGQSNPTFWARATLIDSTADPNNIYANISTVVPIEANGTIQVSMNAVAVVGQNVALIDFSFIKISSATTWIDLE